MKARGGFSFVEIIISFSIFLLLVAVSLPLVNTAARNLAFARDGYEAHLAAGRLLQSARSTLTTGRDLRSAAESLNLGIHAYSVWVVGQNGQTVVRSTGAPETDMSLSGYASMDLTGGLHIVVVVVWGECGSVLGRTVGGVVL